MPAPFDLSLTPVHLGLGATAFALEPFDGTMEWYQRYGERVDAADGNEGRLVSLHTFTESWSSWEVHPHGHELVICVDGAITLIQEVAGEHRSVDLRAGQAVINEPGVWHTADVAAPATAVFVTAGKGTEQRPR